MVHLVFGSPKNPEAQEKFILIDGSQMADSYRHYVTMLRNNRTTYYTEITIIVCNNSPNNIFFIIGSRGTLHAQMSRKCYHAGCMQRAKTRATRIYPFLRMKPDFSCIKAEKLDGENY